MRIQVISRTPYRSKNQVVVIVRTGQKDKRGRELFSSKTLHVTDAELKAMQSNNRDREKDVE